MVDHSNKLRKSWKIQPLAYKAADIAVALAENPTAAPADIAQRAADEQGRFAMLNNGAAAGEKFFMREQAYGKSE